MLEVMAMTKVRDIKLCMTATKESVESCFFVYIKMMYDSHIGISGKLFF